jgi:hypothetical protein
MKKTLFSLAFALVAMLGFQTANAQSLSNYTASFVGSTFTVDGKVGGLGRRVATMEVALFIEVEASVDCSRTNPQGTTERTFYRFSENSGSVNTSGRGSADFPQINVTASSANCPGGWNFLAGGDATLERAWIVLTTKDSNGIVLNISEEIEINL